MAVDLWMPYIIMLMLFIDPDLDAWSQWVGEDKQSASYVLGNYKQAISIKLAATVGQF